MRLEYVYHRDDVQDGDVAWKAAFIIAVKKQDMCNSCFTNAKNISPKYQITTLALDFRFEITTRAKGEKNYFSAVARDVAVFQNVLQLSMHQYFFFF